MKARVTVSTLKRTIGSSAARRYLEKNGYSDQVVQEMMDSSVERRGLRRRMESGAVRASVKRTNMRLTGKDEIFGSLGAEDINALYRLCSANDTEGVFIRVCDCPVQFARFGLMEPGPRGARITERGRATLLHWTRARALLAVSLGYSIDAFEENVKTWLAQNRFIEINGPDFTIVPRGAKWLETRLTTLAKLD